MVSRLKYLIIQALTGLWRSAGVSGLSIGIIAFALSALALFGMVTTNLQLVSDRVSQEAGISAHLSSELTLQGHRRLAKKIEDWPSVKKVELLTSTAAMDWLRINLGTEATVLDGLPSNLLPSSVEIQVRDLGVEGVNQLVKKLEGLDGVDEVLSGQEDVQKIHGLLSLVRTSMLFLAGFLCVAVLFILSNAIRLAVYTRKDEIEVMSLIGGTRFFIGLPFVIEGAFLGFLGGLLSVTLLLGFKEILTQWLYLGLSQTYGPMQIEFMSTQVLGLLVLIGVAVGILGSAYSVLRHIRL